MAQNVTVAVAGDININISRLEVRGISVLLFTVFIFIYEQHRVIICKYINLINIFKLF